MTSDIPSTCFMVHPRTIYVPSLQPPAGEIEYFQSTLWANLGVSPQKQTKVRASLFAHARGVRICKEAIFHEVPLIVALGDYI